MSHPVRCLLDKAAARRTLEGLLRLAEGRELTEEQLWAIDLLQRAKERGIRLFVTTGTINILSQLEDSPCYSAVVEAFFERVEEAQPTRYFKRWARRLRGFGFTREDAHVLALACFGSARSADVLGMGFVVTYDQAMINHWNVQQDGIEKRLKAMRCNLRPPYDKVSLPPYTYADDTSTTLSTSLVEGIYLLMQADPDRHPESVLLRHVDFLITLWPRPGMEQVSSGYDRDCCSAKTWRSSLHPGRSSGMVRSEELSRWCYDQ